MNLTLMGAEKKGYYLILFVLLETKGKEPRGLLHIVERKLERPSYPERQAGV
jgi:hypothetical protein